jgi:hypothetical protein
MAWPTNKPESTKFDNAADSIAESRAELHTMSQAVNDIVDFVDTTGIANDSVLKYNASNGRLEVGLDERVTNPILFGDTITEDSAGQVQGIIEFQSADSEGVDVVRMSTNEADEFNRSEIKVFSRADTDNPVFLIATGRSSGNNKETYQFSTTQVELTGTGINNNGIETRGNRITLTKATDNASYPVASIGTGGEDFYIGSNIGGNLNGGDPAQLLSDSAGEPNQENLNAECIYFDAGLRSIYINTVTNTDSAGNSGDDGHIYLNSQKWPNADGSNGQVLKTNGSGVLSWSNEGSAPNVFVTFQGDSGSTTANATNDTLEIRGGTGITTSMSGDVLTITNDSPATGSGGIINITGGDNIAVSNPDSTGSFEITLSQLSATLNMNDQQLTNMQIKNFGEIINDLGTTSGTLTPDPNNGSVQKMTLNNNLTLNALSNVANGDSLTLIITQDGTGNRTLSSTMKFAGGEKTLSTAANSIDVMTIFYDGTNYLASLSKNFS